MAKCDPNVEKLKAECEALVNADAQKTYLRNQLASIKQKRQAEVVVYVHLQRLLIAIPQAFQAVADGQASHPLKVN